MRNSQKQFSSSELTFHYTNYPHLLSLNGTTQSGELLLKLWKEDCQCKSEKKYVLYLDSKNQFIAWKKLSDSIDPGYCAREIVGSAIACNATRIVFSHHRLDSSEPNAADQLLVRHTFEYCERMAIEILDYLIITHEECLSYKLWLSN